MTSWHDAEMVCDFVRQVFITSDDSGLCEAVLPLPSAVPKPGGVKLLVRSRNGQKRQTGDSSDEGEISDVGSSDILQVDRFARELKQDSSRYRNRSQTFQKLDQERSKKSQRRNIRTVSGKIPDGFVCDESLFRPVTCLQKAEPKNENTQHKKPVKSLATQMILSASKLPPNPFQKYAKFDGQLNALPVLKKLCIFVPQDSRETLNSSNSTTNSDVLVTPNTNHQQPTARNRKPPEITLNRRTKRPSSQNHSVALKLLVDANAKVSDVIGLVAYHYSLKKLSPPLQGGVADYCLFMADEVSGEADDDLPALDPNDPISKYGFKALALVPRALVPLDTDYPVPAEGASPTVVVSSDLLGPLTLTLEDSDTTLRQIRDVAAKGHKLSRGAAAGSDDRRPEYNLEDFDKPGEPLNLDSLLSSVSATHFYLVRKNCARCANWRDCYANASSNATGGRTGAKTSFLSAKMYMPPPSPSNVSTASLPFLIPVQKHSGLCAVPSTSSMMDYHYPKSVSVVGSSAEDCVVSNSFYPVNTYSKLKLPANEVRLGIFPDKIALISRASARKSPRIFNRSTSDTNIPMEMVGGCEPISGAKGRSTFKIHFKSNDDSWKAHHFEGDAQIVAEINRRINRFAVRAGSEARSEYVNRTPFAGSRKVTKLFRKISRSHNDSSLGSYS